MEQYRDAARALSLIRSGKGLKSAIFESRSANVRRTFALVTEIHKLGGRLEALIADVPALASVRGECDPDMLTVLPVSAPPRFGVGGR